MEQAVGRVESKLHGASACEHRARLVGVLGLEEHLAVRAAVLLRVLDAIPMREDMNVV